MLEDIITFIMTGECKSELICFLIQVQIKLKVQTCQKPLTYKSCLELMCKYLLPRIHAYINKEKDNHQIQSNECTGLTYDIRFSR